LEEEVIFTDQKHDPITKTEQSSDSLIINIEKGSEDENYEDMEIIEEEDFTFKQIK